METQVAQYGKALCQTMLETVDFTPIIRTLVRERSVKNEAEARELLDAFLQWIALIPAIDRGRVFVMLKTPVDEVFHAFVLNTAFYQEFCQRFFGFFIHHNPLDGETGSQIDDGVRYTMELLEEHYGKELHPALRAWRNQIDAGAYTVSCINCPYTSEMGRTVEAKLPTGASVVH